MEGYHRLISDSVKERIGKFLFGHIDFTPNEVPAEAEKPLGRTDEDWEVQAEIWSEHSIEQAKLDEPWHRGEKA